MKHQQVSVDYWTMAKTMLIYGALSVLFWIMLRLFNTVFTFPARMRSQQDKIQETIKELQKRFPDLNITEEDLKNAEKELEEFCKEHEDSEEQKDDNSNKIDDGDPNEEIQDSENKKDI